MAVIHVVEDESLVRGYLGDMLSEAGQQVIEAENADRPPRDPARHPHHLHRHQHARLDGWREARRGRT
jgi:CheY-like chemotaxis protein